MIGPLIPSPHDNPRTAARMYGRNSQDRIKQTDFFTAAYINPFSRRLMRTKTARGPICP